MTFCKNTQHVGFKTQRIKPNLETLDFCVKKKTKQKAEKPHDLKRPKERQHEGNTAKTE